MTPRFDRVARAYRWLEYATFGRLLERARFAFIDRLAPCRRILVIGDGDGRFLARLVRIAPHAEVRSIDASAAMLRLAEARVPKPDRARVTFECADVLAADLPPATYDAIVTLFVLDCFTDAQLATLVPRLARSGTDRAMWLFADFAVPAHGVVRPLAAVVVCGLYAFFRVTASLRTARLPAAHAAITSSGFVRDDERSLAGGLIETRVYRK